MDQITAGVEFRKKYAMEEKWNQWRDYYRGQWRSGILPSNLFFSTFRAMMPRIYFRNPAVSVTPAIGGFENMAFAQAVHRIDNTMIRTMGVKQELRDMVLDGIMTGTAIGKLGLGAQYTPAPSMLPGDTEAPEPLFMGRGERFEYHPRVVANMPWFMRTGPGHYVVPDGCRRQSEARWVAHWIRRPKDDVERDPRLDKKGREALPSSTSYSGTTTNTTVQHRVEMVDLWEIRDLKFRQAIVLAPYSNREFAVLYQGDDQLSARRFPFFKLVFNEDDEVFWGVPEAQILEPYQLEMNEIRTQTMKHRRAALVKLLGKRGVLDDIEKAKLLSEDVAAFVEVDGEMADIQHITQADIPASLIPAGELVRQDAREAVGFGRNQMGEYQSRRGDTSAAEAQFVQEGSELRIDDKRVLVAELLVDMIEEMNQIIFNNWTEEQVVDVVGPGGVPIWVKVHPQLLRSGRYTVRVDPDSSTGRTRAQREAKSVGLYKLLKENPFIDPMKLTQYLLNEMEGVELDDLMRALPPEEGGGAQGVMSMPQYAGKLQQGFQRMMRQGPGAALQLGAGAGG
jgi:hypothetical protein